MLVSDVSPTTTHPTQQLNPDNICHEYSGIFPSATRTLECGCPNVQGRYLFILIPGTSERLTMCEVQVRGEIPLVDY